MGVGYVLVSARLDPTLLDIASTTLDSTPVESIIQLPEGVWPGDSKTRIEQQKRHCDLATGKAMRPLWVPAEP